ncbi:relaxase domain-containing protein [Streptomyces europaeiscabiei]|uniref:relaxase domain-containing protein n=1 Tax=Streptomyces europaeiscabiei TaxID=146819 RepID=UPI003990BDA6
MTTQRTAAGTLYSPYFMVEASARFGWAWEPREVTLGKGPVMEIAGIDWRLIEWQSTRRQQAADTLPVLVADVESAGAAGGACRHARPPPREPIWKAPDTGVESGEEAATV